MSAWRELAEFDRDALQALDHARVQAAELDVARSHFLGLRWRLFCMASAALWSSAAISVGTGYFGGSVTVAVGVGAASGALLAGFLLLGLELRAGARGRAELERTARFGELSAARAFQERVSLGAEGELLQRATAWRQAAFSVRESAARLLSLEQMALDGATRDSRRAESDDSKASLGSYVESTTVRGGVSAAIARLTLEMERSLLTDSAEFRAEFELWWSSTLRDLDPNGVGSVPAGLLRPRLVHQLAESKAQVRRRLLDRFESQSAEAWMQDILPEVAKRLGTAADLAGLSVRTELSRNERRDTVILAISTLRSTRRMLADAARRSAFGRNLVSEIEVNDDIWCGFGLLVEDIAIRFESDAEGHTRICEGRAPGRQSAKDTA